MSSYSTYIIVPVKTYRNQVIQIAISGWRKPQSPEADVVESFVVDAESFVGVLYELVHGESRVVGLHYCVRYLVIEDNVI